MTASVFVVFLTAWPLQQVPNPPVSRPVMDSRASPNKRSLLPARTKLPFVEELKDKDKNLQRDPWVYPTAERLQVDTNGRVIATGHVFVRTSTQTIRADKVTYDPKTRIAACIGHVSYMEEGIVVEGDSVSINVDSYDFDVINGRVVVDAARTGGSALQAMRFEGVRVSKSGNVITAVDGVFTTCDLEVPHGDVRFDSCTFILDERLILRGVSIRRLRRTILRIPHLSVPLNERRQGGWLPAFGRTNEEGYFIKAAVGYALGTQLPGLIRVDLMERKGIGLGFDQVYRFSGPQTGAGRLVMYDLKDSGRGVHNQNLRFEHEQRLGEFDLRLTSDKSQNSYQSAISGARSRSNGFTLVRPGVQRPFSLSVVDSASGSAYARSGTRTLSTTQGIKIGSSFLGNVKYTEITNGTTSGSAAQPTVIRSKRALAELNARGPLGSFDAQIQANRVLSSQQSGPGGGSAFFGGTERLPEIRLQMRKPPIALNGILSSATFGYGRFLESSVRGGIPQALGTNRFLTDVSAKAYERQFGNASFRSSSRFTQTIYDNALAAQYVLENTTSLSDGAENGAGWSFAYRYNRPYGGVPVGFRLDRVGSSNIFTASRTLATEHFYGQFGTAFDIERSREPLFPGAPRRPWANLQAQLAGVVSSRLALRSTLAWDPNTKAIVAAQYGIQSQLADAFYSDIAFSYEPRLHQWSQIAGRLGGWVFGRDTRVLSQVSYSGFSKKFDYKSLAVEHTFHDYVMTVAYIDQPFGFRSETGVNIGLRLRAFPVGDLPQSGRMGTARDSGFGGANGKYGLQAPFFTGGGATRSSNASPSFGGGGGF